MAVCEPTYRALGQPAASGWAVSVSQLNDGERGLNNMNRPIEVVHEPGFDFAVGLLHGQICSNLTRDEVERKLRQHPPGTTAGWEIKDAEVCPCPDKSGWVHYHVTC